MLRNMWSLFHSCVNLWAVVHGQLEISSTLVYLIAQNKHLTSNSNAKECDCDMIKLERPTVHSPKGTTDRAPLVNAACAKDFFKFLLFLFFFFGHCTETKSSSEDFASSAVARFSTIPLMLLCSV